MRCRSAQQKVSRRLDALLSSGAALRLDLHLRSCAECRLFAARVEQSWAMLSLVPTPTGAPDDWWRIARALGERGHRWSWDRVRWRRAPASMAAACLVGFMAIVGGAAGVYVSRAALRRSPTGVSEAVMLAQAFEDLPWASPGAAFIEMLDLDEARSARLLAPPSIAR